MNPAITLALLITNHDKIKWGFALMTMGSQTVGGLLGMQLGHLLRGSANRQVYPTYIENVPGTAKNGDPDYTPRIAIVILTTEMVFTFVYGLVYLNAKYAYRKATQSTD